ncbi:MAG: sigma-70 family RNA polymerase sigma factor [Betaproteobacteria bacterium]
MTDKASPAGGGETFSQLLSAWANHDPAARDALVPLVYDELHRLAHRYMRDERSGHTLQTTALVNEAYVRLAGVERLEGDRPQFFALAATIMRRVLVDHARARGRDKRGGGVELTPLGDAVPAPGADPDVLALDEALERLALLDARQAAIVDLRYFAGLTVEETAAVVGVSPATVKREWAIAKAWLYRELTPPDAAPRP